MQFTPQRTAISQAISEKHKSERKSFKRRINDNSYIKEKVGENKYIYRLKNVSRKGSTCRRLSTEIIHKINDINSSKIEEPQILKKEPEIRKLESVYKSGDFNNEKENEIINVSKELIIKSLSHVNDKEEPKRQERSTRESMHKKAGFSGEIIQTEKKIDQRDYEILQLKQENEQLRLKNLELSSMNDVIIFC
jgi:hypothetical protein